MNRPVLIAVAAISVLLTSGCGFGGIQQLQLPGTVGTGAHATRITVELPDVTTLTTNAQVKVDDIAVGTVTKLTSHDWHAIAQVSLEPRVKLPANAVATVGINSVLGSGYLKLAAPAHPSATPLRDGATIPLADAGAYPTTEQVLAAASVVLNGSGLEQVSTITTELNRALGGDQQAVSALLPRLASFVTEVNTQRSQIVSTIQSLNAVSQRLNANRDVINGALESFPGALHVLAQERHKLTTALTSVGEFGIKATALIQASQHDLVANLQNLSPTLRAVALAGSSIVASLGFLVTFPFPPETAANACRGDYCNLWLTLDLSSKSLLEYLAESGGVTGLLSNGANSTGSTLSGLLQGLLGTSGGTSAGSNSSGLLGGLLGGSGSSTSTSGGAGPSPGAGTGASLCQLVGSLLSNTSNC